MQNANTPHPVPVEGAEYIYKLPVLVTVKAHIVLPGGRVMWVGKMRGESDDAPSRLFDPAELTYVGKSATSPDPVQAEQNPVEQPVPVEAAPPVVEPPAPAEEEAQEQDSPEQVDARVSRKLVRVSVLSDLLGISRATIDRMRYAGMPASKDAARGIWMYKPYCCAVWIMRHGSMHSKKAVVKSKQLPGITRPIVFSRLKRDSRVNRAVLGVLTGNTPGFVDYAIKKGLARCSDETGDNHLFCLGDAVDTISQLKSSAKHKLYEVCPQFRPQCRLLDEEEPSESFAMHEH